MSLAEFQQHEAEITRWARAGSIDGQPAPHPGKRPDGHVFTVAEIDAMSLDEFRVNEPAIDAAMRSGPIAKTSADIPKDPT